MGEGTQKGTVQAPPAVAKVSVEASLTHALSHLADAILLLDENWCITYANQTARRISRIQPENLNCQTHWELYPETVGTELERAYRGAMEKREPRVVKAFYYAPFDTWFDVHVLPVPGGVAVHYRDVTAVHKAETARDAASEQLHQALEATTDGVVSLDRAWTIVFVNGRAREILAASGEVLGANLWERFPDAARPDSPFYIHYHRAMDENIGGQFEAAYAEPLNTRLYLIVKPYKDGITVFFRDVTEQRAQEDALRASEQRYRVLTELNPQALWTADAQGRVLYANQTFIEYLGKGFVLSNGDEYISRFDPADRERVVATWTHSVTTGQEYIIDARLIRDSDKASRWWHVRALPLRDPDGQIQQWLGVATDVHENRIAAQQLREQFAEIDQSRRRLGAIYEGSPIGMALYDAKDLRLLQVNSRQAAFLGLPPHELIGRTLDETAPGMTEVHALIRRAAAGEAVLNHPVEGEVPTLPGQRRYWTVNYTPIVSEDGTVQAVAGATVEVTHQKRAEAALIQSEKLAAAGRLAASIAHEINNPLEAVMNLIFLARSYAILPEVQQLLDTADQELRRVSIIAGQTLRFHRQSSKASAIGCADLYSTVLSMYEGKLRNAGISVEKRKRALKPVVCFEGEIRQVLNNLVGNAIDSMPSGGRLLVRSREAIDHATGRMGLVLTVADTGTGIDKQTQARMFEAFFTTKGIGGTGLGLWISAEITERHQGRLRIRSSQSEAHHGTVATLFLPFEAEPIRSAQGQELAVATL